MFFLSPSPHFIIIITLLHLSALKLRHQRQLSDVKDQFEHEKSRIDNRDVSNAQEIDTLHRKCICLTKL